MFLLDTNVVSELRKARPDANVLAWHAANVAAEAYLSVLVIGEIRRGIELVRPRDAPKADALDRWLAGLLGTFDGRILPVTAEIAQEWGSMIALSNSPAIDGLIAATAKVHRLTLVTRNTADVAATGVPIINPFQPARPDEIAERHLTLEVIGQDLGVERRPKGDAGRKAGGGRGAIPLRNRGGSQRRNPSP